MNRSGCGETKGCLFKPAGCDPQLDCTLGIVFYVTEPNQLRIQMVAQSLFASTTVPYLAVGFSKDALMGDDLCRKGEVEDGRLPVNSTSKSCPVEQQQGWSALELNRFVIGARKCSARRNQCARHQHWFPLLPLVSARPIDPSLIGKTLFELPAPMIVDSATSVFNSVLRPSNADTKPEESALKANSAIAWGSNTLCILIRWILAQRALSMVFH
uniref:Uncharacterized protein n=1 Tax=Ditylenchus dipsaci TaxID=166011 RepID=A0A915EHE5_9BILA